MYNSIAMSFFCVCIVCIVFTISPPYSPVDPATTASDIAVYDYFVDDPTPYYRASRQAVPLHLSQISPIFLRFSIALGIAAATLDSYSNA